ncbi:hypothetical protein DDV21_010290 [Streptococcus chenjunshii]|uniref:Uncharacterized protein n=1 Tax=Streptococcus chenjunshii TaxID=2173853 RepID=A0A372KMR2_9STRE|nr:hypothetical protein [Streptococcus chenjunshii]AXQ79436.1 hypothetical protein DDV21_010290 [Streptococcus chenjunshii]RFU51106.1 hypothetical protein DDV22_05210 [Streptococcus chenjunshii]RFU53204.1 hypothetical protein DDV23_05720 [Streptococcus chenjunshii]
MWTELRLREADAEEREFFGSDWVWNGPVPEEDERVLVSNGIDVWIDTWVYADSQNAGLENEPDGGNGLFWAPLPEPPKVKNGRRMKNEIYDYNNDREC